MKEEYRKEDGEDQAWGQRNPGYIRQQVEDEPDQHQCDRVEDAHVLDDRRDERHNHQQLEYCHYQ